MSLLITDHLYKGDFFGRDECDVKVDENGRARQCGERRSNHLSETERPPYSPVDVPIIITGEKKDEGKQRWDLLPWRQVAKIVQVVTFGAKKYAPDNWQHVPDARSRYFAAAMRHAYDWWSGERNDPESGLHHLAHAGCDLLFLMWFDDQ